MKTLILRNHVISKETVSVFVPLVGKTLRELEEELRTLDCCDVIEWRVDCFAEADNLASVCAAGHRLRSQTRLPILFTYRTHHEGGFHVSDDVYYFALLEAAVRQGFCDAVDIELLRPTAPADRVIALAHEQGIKVILSNHDFESSPPDDVLEARLREMVRRRADLPKIACMPQTKSDVIRLLNLTARVSPRVESPLIMIAMGELGFLSRVAGGLFGSNVSFGSNRAASAPGQISACELKQMLSYCVPEPPQCSETDN